MAFMPETPRFLLRQNRQPEAIVALQFLRGPLVDHEWECREIEANAGEQVKGNPEMALGLPLCLSLP